MGKIRRDVSEKVTTFTEFKKVNEFFGGGTKDIMIPRVSELIKYIG